MNLNHIVLRVWVYTSFYEIVSYEINKVTEKLPSLGVVVELARSNSRATETPAHAVRKQRAEQACQG